MDAAHLHVRDVTGPDRTLPCGCVVIDGAICIISSVHIDTAYARAEYHRPGRVIPVNPGEQESL